ncbi:MAG: chromate transporter [Clostridia bacterium]|nr:chromate transporter [Clostridia bacterium]
MILLKLFFAFAKVGLFSFGGGYAALPLIQDMIVTELAWMTEAEFTDIMVISEMTPGPITINAATFVGINEAGLGGAIAATLGFVFPSAVIISILALLLKKYGSLKPVRDVLSVMRPCVIGLIASAGLKMLLEAVGEGSFIAPSFDIFAAALFTAGVIVMRKMKPSPIVVMASSGIIGIFIYAIPELLA